MKHLRRFNESSLSIEDIKDEFLAIEDEYDIKITVQDCIYSDKDKKIESVDYSTNDNSFKKSFYVKIPIKSDRIERPKDYNGVNTIDFIDKEMFDFILKILSHKDFDYKISIEGRYFSILVVTDELASNKNKNSILFVEEFCKEISSDHFDLKQDCNRLVIYFNNIKGREASKFLKSTFRPNIQALVRVDKALQDFYNSLKKKYNVKEKEVNMEHVWDRCFVTFEDL